MHSVTEVEHHFPIEDVAPSLWVWEVKKIDSGLLMPVFWHLKCSARKQTALMPCLFPWEATHVIMH